MYWVAAGGGEAQYMLEKWQSVTNHVSNIHSHQGKLYTECPHGPIDQERDWIRPGSRAYNAVKEVVESKYLLRGIPKLSTLYQTYSLEVFHNVVNHFAPKSHHFFYPAMKARMYIAAFHYNENSQNTQAVTKAGEPRWTISYPKAKKGTSSVAKPVNKGPTYEYVEFLLNAIVERRKKFPSYKMAGSDYERQTADCPGFLTQSFVRTSKQELVNSLTDIN
ncbi:uncharacterized protein LOC124124714 isoform X2 [Haliotis rufescens]|nr:uncharacterized protein LOC124124714 isoform X2 [Haliotis rufescens]XP_048240075.1 uncharacterized protein LOC124124714 isoform X2 [Haliotis rufescens]XP_048240076.1 uncharacterized protein LOC124124714 isoform X2 [Haliotis rufescens]